MQSFVLGMQTYCIALLPIFQLPILQWTESTDFVEKLRKRCAAKIRPNDIVSENRCSMPRRVSLVRPETKFVVGVDCNPCPHSPASSGAHFAVATFFCLA